MVVVVEVVVVVVVVVVVEVVVVEEEEDETNGMHTRILSNRWLYVSSPLRNSLFSFIHLHK